MLSTNSINKHDLVWVFSEIQCPQHASQIQGLLWKTKHLRPIKTDMEKLMFFCKTLLHIAADYKRASDPFLEEADTGLFRKQLKKKKSKI